MRHFFAVLILGLALAADGLPSDLSVQRSAQNSALVTPSTISWGSNDLPADDYEVDADPEPAYSDVYTFDDLYPKLKTPEELQETARKVVKYLDDNIKALTKDFARLAPVKFAAIKAQFGKFSDAEMDNILNLATVIAISRAEIPASVAPSTMKAVLKTYLQMFKNFVKASTDHDVRRMASNLGRYARYAWTTLSEEAKEIVAFSFVSYFEIRGKPLPIQI